MGLSASLRRKLVAVGLATAFFLACAAVLGPLVGVPLDQSLLGGGLIGLGVSLFEEFFVQGRAGRRLRAMHPLKSLPLYSAVVVAIALIAQHLMHLVLGRLDRLPEAYARLPKTLPLIFVVAAVGILILRVIGFIGGKTLFHLLIGRYHRPVIERKVFLFLDMRDSTAFVQTLGPVKAKALIGKFLFDISKPVTDHKGDIYLYTGDGVIAMWNWSDAIRDRNIVRTVDAIREAVRVEAEAYRAAFGRVPEFRIGVHGGDVVISEQGDAKRAIGVYGETINIAARMEQTAKLRERACVFSADIVEQLGAAKERFEYMGEETVKGISAPIAIDDVHQISIL